MNIQSFTLYIISKPLKHPFSTHLETVVDRESIIVELTDSDGLKGYGEVVAFSSPWYTEETVKTAYHMIKDFFIPLLKNNPVNHPNQVTPLLDKFRRNQMAKAGLETAYWDLFAKQQGVPLSKLLGGTQTDIPSGVVVATSSLDEAYRQIEGYLESGYKRVKLKISPGHDVEIIEPIRNRYPDLALMADANSAYSLRDKDVERLKALDSFDLLMIEQPLAHDDIIEHTMLQQQIRTPICLDESIVTFEDARNAIEMGSCQVINLKIGRVGGLQTSKRIHDLAVEKGIAVWVGGMIEFGVSRAHNIALAALPGFTIAGDISASSRYWDEDIITPEVVVNHGRISMPSGVGIGLAINEQSLMKATLHKETVRL